MKVLFRIFFFLIFAVIIVTISNSQSPPYNFGDLPDEHLLMEEYPPDPDASAVILFDYGEVAFDHRLHVVFKRHRRIKILTEDGFDWGAHSISYTARGGAQLVRNLEGITVNRGPDGTPVIHTLESEDIYDERVSARVNRIRFTMPAIERGSIVEYRYTITSNDPIYLPDWSFQASEPVLWSEYNASIPDMLQFMILTQGFHRFYISESEAYRSGGWEFDQGRSFRWVMRDLSAIREEPFMTTVEDYKSKITFQLSVIRPPYDVPVRVLNTWSELVQNLLSSRDFGRNLSPHRSISRRAAALTEGITDPVQKLEKIYNYLQETMVWNGSYRVFPSDRIRNVYEEKTGNSADINFLLINMLRSADIEAHPVILSTRNNGKIQSLYPIVRQFNHVIAYADINGEEFILDATNRYTPVNLLPYNALNDVGLMIRHGEVRWVSLAPAAGYVRSITGTLKLEEDGAVSANMQVIKEGYGAVSERTRIENEGEKEMLKALLGSEEPVISLDSFSIVTSDDNNFPLISVLSFSSDDYAFSSDDFISLNPTILGRIEENPFMLLNRTFPVDFAFLWETSVSAEILIPVGFEVVGVPETVQLSLEEERMTYTRRVIAKNDVILLERSFKVNDHIFSPDEYQEIRSFYEDIVRFETQQLVLERISDAGNTIPVTGDK